MLLSKPTYKVHHARMRFGKSSKTGAGLIENGYVRNII